MDWASGQILATAFAPGSVHDFALFKVSRLCFHDSTQVMADTGYQGLKKWHKKSETPHKRTKKKRLTSEQKQDNRRIAQQRIVGENVLGDLKRFTILRGPYRNHTKRFTLRFNLLAALHNYHL